MWVIHSFILFFVLSFVSFLDPSHTRKYILKLKKEGQSVYYTSNFLFFDLDMSVLLFLQEVIYIAAVSHLFFPENNIYSHE